MTMDTDLTHLLYFIVYQVFPYVVITVWLVGSFIRFLTHPYTVKSQSSELLGGKKEINWGARFFHVGVIGLLFGHLFGLFVPKQFLLDIGITPQMTRDHRRRCLRSALPHRHHVDDPPTHHQPAHSQDLASE